MKRRSAVRFVLTERKERVSAGVWCRRASAEGALKFHLINVIASGIF